MKYFSIFSGIGGFEIGIQRGSTKNQRQSKMPSFGDTKGQPKQQHDRGEQGLSCVGYSEVDKYAIQIYEKQFKGHKNYGDCARIDWKTVPDFDCLVGGFPCQAFSIAGRRGGFTDTRGTLFFEIARCLKEKQPRLCVLENVKGLLSHDKGATFTTIITTLDELGYDCQWQVLNSKNFGVPQNRERVFIIGHLRGTSRPEVFPIEGNGGKDFTPTLRATYYKGYQTKGPMIVDASYPNRKPREYSDYAPTIRDYGSGGNKMPLVEGIRRLTPTECERLQGFPDGWTEGISDTQRYKCLGNAVTVNVIQAIFERILL